MTKPIDFAAIDGNQIAVCMEPDNLDTFMKNLDSPASGGSHGLRWGQARDRQGVRAGQGVQSLGLRHSEATRCVSALRSRA